MELQIKHSNVFTRNYNALEDKSKRFIINQGGTRSSKTYSICQLLIWYAYTNKNKVISIVRKSFPALRSSVMRDFITILKELNIYSESNHNMTENIYTFPSGTVIEFFSIDDEQKVRGRKRDLLFCNEANELSYDEFLQLNMRTTSKIIFDYNPSDNNHFIYQLIVKDESLLIKSTYKDNPFLSQDIINQIEDLINADENYYRVYCLGEQGIHKTSIYSNYEVGKYQTNSDTFYGLDFGMTHPTALIEISPFDNSIFSRQLIYKSGLTADDLMNEMESLNISKTKEIIADGARPEIIEHIKRRGYNIKAADKSQGSVKEGINAVKSYRMILDSDSTDLIREIKNYKYKTRGEEVLDEPVKAFDDAMDALRYVVHFYYKQQKRGKPTFETFVLNI